MDLPSELLPLAGGYSGETFLAEVAGESTVVRIYGPRSRWRGPLAPEVDAAVLDLVRGLLPVPRVLEVRRGDPDSDVPGLLVTELLPGERLDLVLPGLGGEDRRRLGVELGVVAARLGHLAQTRRGVFADRSLQPVDSPYLPDDLPQWLEDHAGRLDPHVVDGLRPVLDRAQALLDQDERACLVHSDLNPKNLLVDPDTLEVTGVLDWEFAHSGLPWSDLGNLLRLDRDPELTDGVLAGYRSTMPVRPPAVPEDVLDRARAADLFALVELASRTDDELPVTAARGLLAAIAATGDVHAVPERDG